MPVEPQENQESLLSAARRTTGEMIRVILLSLAIILPVRYFLIQPFYVKGASMEPNFYDHEYLVIDELSYRFRPPQRGEIVVFRPPGNGNQYFIKRVIGLPGETVMVDKGQVKITSASSTYSLDESAYLSGIYTPGEVSLPLKPSQYFLLGDNRYSSLDSRAFGPVQLRSIVGRAWLRGWPLDKIGTVPEASYPSYDL